ncbi:MAG: ChbG/HpnK family deacetylase [Acidobacteria bacterium]|nr:ChbG/HpnK family deacetylase [Acidobacteriota bacterium]
MARRLIINADDFGFTTDVNSGIGEAHSNGILTATTLMANGRAFDHAVELARRRPTLDVGCHLVLVGGKAIAEPHSSLPATVGELLRRLVKDSSRNWLERELAAQVEKILRAGLEPSHLDTHKHTHLVPAVLEAVCRVSRRYSIPWIRRPFDLPLTAAAPLSTRLLNAGFRFLRDRFERTVARYQCRTTDHFAGFQWTGNYRAPELAGLIRRLPDGLTEFMCHPGHCTDELRQAPTRLKESREQELQALISPEARLALENSGVQLTTYRDVLNG